MSLLFSDLAKYLQVKHMNSKGSSRKHPFCNNGISWDTYSSHNLSNSSKLIEFLSEDGTHFKYLSLTAILDTLLNFTHTFGYICTEHKSKML